MSFDHGSTSDTGIDSQMSWNSIQTSAQNWLPVYRISSSPTNVEPLHPSGHTGLTGQWSLGETSSGSAAQSQHHHSENEKEHVWSGRPQAAITLEESPCEPSNIRSMDNVDDVDVNDHQTVIGSSLLQIPGPDLNLDSEFANDDCQVRQHSNTFLSQIPSTGSASESLGMTSEFVGYMTGENEDRPGCSIDGQRMSCKRKALEIHAGQSSGAGSSNAFQPAERSQRLAVPAAQITQRRVSLPIQTEPELANNNESEQANSRLRLDGGRAVSATSFSFARAAPADISGRNFCLPFSGLPPQDHIPRNSSPTEANVCNADVSSSQQATGFVPCNNRLLDTNPALHVENGNLLNVPSGYRNPQSRWGGASTSRTSISSALTNSQERDDVLSQESASRNIPRSISEHPMLVPASEAGSTTQQPNWIFYDESSGVAGNAASTPWAGSSSRVDPSAPAWYNWSRPQYTRRISDIVRRSLSSSAAAASGGQTSSHAPQSGSPATSQGTAISSGSGSHAPHLLNSRSPMLERHPDGDFRMPYLMRNLAAAGEGRSSVMSEIRHVLDLMRRGEGLRFEDVMMLDHPAFFGMPDIHDRHRDMRLDVDNMSYEELLALEERIGNVCTGLNEEAIMSHLRRTKYTNRRSNQDQPDTTEPCSICREEYKDGEDLGTLECDHDFHADCIKQWLMHKNLCPICKTTGLST